MECLIKTSPNPLVCGPSADHVRGRLIAAGKALIEAEMALGAIAYDTSAQDVFAIQKLKGLMADMHDRVKGHRQPITTR